jgi:hypothetical protein
VIGLGKHSDNPVLLQNYDEYDEWDFWRKMNPYRINGKNKLPYLAKFLLHDDAIKHYSLRSIEYGNWMDEQDKAEFLYGSMSSLTDLATLFGVSESQIGFNGKITISFDSRDIGGSASSHYVRMPYSVISLSKDYGRGSLAKEYAHAIDNLVSYYTQSTQNFVSGGKSTRKDIDENVVRNGNYFELLFERLFAQLYWSDSEQTRYHKVLNEIPEELNRRATVFAHVFEYYVHHLMNLKGIKNNFLSHGSYSGYYVYPDRSLLLKVSPILDEIIKAAFQLFSENTLSGVTTSRTLKRNAKLEDTLFHMKRIVMRDFSKMEEFANQFRADSIQEVSRKIWNWMRENTTYKLDSTGIEELRTPERSLRDKDKGIDCDDYTILISSILMNLGIAHEFRIAAYKEKGRFQHIYPVAFDEKGNEYVIDCVPEIPHFNFEATPIIDLKTVTIMELQELSGVSERNDLQEELNAPFELAGIEEDDYALEKSFLHGFAEVSSEADADIVIAGAEDVADVMEKGILAEINKARNLLIAEQSRPTVLSKTIDVRKELSMMNELMDAFDDEDEREELLEQYASSTSAYQNFYKALILSLRELDSDELNGFDDEPIYLAKVDMEAYDLSEIMSESVDGLGRLRLRKFFKKIGNKLKKAAKAVVKYNPATITMRAATLLVLKTNLFKIASRLIYGYLTESQANANNLNLSEWKKLVDARKKAENFYVKMGGKASKFRDAIVKGKAAKKTGLQLGVAATATTTAAASSFIAFAKKILKAINPKNLFKKIKDKKDKSGNDTFVDEQDFDVPVDEADTSDTSSTQLIRPRTMNTETSTDSQEIIIPDAEPKGVMAKVKSFFTTHKKKIIGGGIALVLIIVGVSVYKKKKQKTKRSLAGAKAARTRKRNAASKKRSYTRKKRTPALRGSTTIIKVPTKSVNRTRVSKRSNANRLKAMHKKAKQLQKSSPRAKYSTLLRKASKMI